MGAIKVALCFSAASKRIASISLTIVSERIGTVERCLTAR